MSSVPSMSPPEPVGDGAAARTDNSLLSHSTMSQASSPRGSAAEGPQLGDVILNRIIHAGGTAELWEELGDDGTYPPQLLVFTAFSFAWLCVIVLCTSLPCCSSCSLKEQR